jgi:hypothetical protein
VKWRKKIHKIAKKLNPKNILDVATGTADIAIIIPAGTIFEFCFNEKFRFFSFNNF